MVIEYTRYLRSTIGDYLEFGCMDIILNFNNSRSGKGSRDRKAAWSDHKDWRTEFKGVDFAH